MGDRVLMQVFSSVSGEFGPVVYGHWSGAYADQAAADLKARMGDRHDDVAYASARLVQCLIDASGGQDGCLSFGIWNAEHKLTDKDSHGDRGCILIDASKGYVAFNAPAVSA
jgi:hypothetical protein